MSTQTTTRVRRSATIFSRRVRRQSRVVTNAALDTVTPLGWCVIIGGVLSLVAALFWAWIEAWAIAFIAIILVMVALPFLVGTRAYQVRIQLPKTRVIAGDKLAGQIDVKNRGLRPAMPAIAELPVGNALSELTVPFLGPNSESNIPFNVDTSRRGIVTVGPLTVAKQDPVGLFRREMTWRDRHTVFVHPRTIPLPPHTSGLVRDLEGSTAGKITDSDLNFHAIREYAPGDDPRHIHWKSTAKTGKLMIRQYEETQTARVALIFDSNMSSYVNVDEFELGVSIAASFGLQAVRDRRERYISATEELASRTPSQLLDQFTGLNAAEFEVPLDTLTRHLVDSRRDLSIVMLITGSQTDAKTLRRCNAVLPPNAITLAARADLNTDPTLRKAGTLTLLNVGKLEDLPHLLIRGN
ncbi:MAG: DUF58 domain-containing protein [Canibacter sp.]